MDTSEEPSEDDDSEEPPAMDVWSLWQTVGKVGCGNWPVLLVKTEDQAQGVGATRDLLLCMSPQQKGVFQGRYSLWFGLFLSKDPQAELPVLVGLEGGGHNEILSAGQRHAPGDLAQVHVGVGPGCWLVPCKESTACLHICAVFQLWRMRFCQKPFGSSLVRQPPHLNFSASKPSQAFLCIK